MAVHAVVATLTKYSEAAPDGLVACHQLQLLPHKTEWRVEFPSRYTQHPSDNCVRSVAFGVLNA